MRVLIDIDGVLVQWKRVFREYLIEAGFDPGHTINWDSSELPLSYYQRWLAWNRMGQPNEAFNLKPFPGAIEGVKTIAAKHDVYFVTAQVVQSPTWAFDRTRWLIKYFGEEQGKKVVFTHHKYLVKGDVFIDDKEYNIKAWSEAWPDGLAVLWDHPHNRKPFHAGVRFDNWTELCCAINDRSLNE